MTRVGSFSNRALIVGFFAFFLATLLVGNASIPVFEQDEAAYAGFARHMVVDGQWVVPQHPYSLVHRKPPLAFWGIAASFKVLGVNEFALRLPSVLAAVATVACVWWGGRFIMGRQVACLAAMVLASSSALLAFGKMGMTDAMLMLFETIAALALLRGLLQPSWRATITLWLAVAAGVLTKGPPILILVGCMFVVLLVLHPKRWHLVHLHPWFGLPLSLVPMAIWLHCVWQQDPRYVLFLVDFYVLRRSGVFAYEGPTGPPGIYYVWLFIMLLPWTAYLPAALLSFVRRLRRRRLADVLLLAWLTGGWLIWELLSSKLPQYVMGALPALAILLAREVIRHVRGRTSWAGSLCLRLGFRILLVMGCLTAIACFVLGVAMGRIEAWLGIVPTAVVLGVTLRAFLLARRERSRQAVRLLLIGSLAMNLAVWRVSVAGVQRSLSFTQRVAEALARSCRPGSTVIMGNRLSVASLPFHIEQNGLKPVELWEPRSNLGPVRVDWSLFWRGRRADLLAQIKAELLLQEPLREGSAEPRILSLLRSGRRAAWILEPSQYETISQAFPGAGVQRIEGLTGSLKRRQCVIVIPTDVQR